MKQKIESLQKPTLLLGKTFALLVSLHFSILFVGCAPSKKNQSVRWSKQSSKDLPESINHLVQNESFKAGSVFTKGAKESVEIIPQKIAGARVEGGYLQKVFNDDGELIYVVGSEAVEPTEKLKKNIEALNLSKYEIVQRIKVKNYELQNASVIFNPEVIVDGQGLSQTAYISQDYILKDGTAAKRMKISEAGIIVGVEPIGSRFHDARGIVFPEGPKISTLQETILKNLIGDGTLSTLRLVATSQAEDKAFSTDDKFFYDPADVRFTQVQAFFYVDNALSWFTNVLKVTIPFKIEIETNVGAPARTNSFFYYNGKIRLGDGDGVNYKNIPHDPSIVTHETCHSLVQALAQLPYEGEGGSLNEGFSDFFTTAMFDNPKLAEASYMKGAFKRTVEVPYKLSDKNGALYHDSGILSGTFWQIRLKIGTDASLRLAVKTLSRIGPGGDFSSVRPAVEDALKEDFTATEIQTVQSVLGERGF
jgi:Zn-dependent metalloprotease